MTTIHEIRDDYNRAKAMPHGLSRARTMLWVQRDAAHSRSKHAYKIECDAHLACVCALDNAPGAGDYTRSELGRIRAESQYLFARGHTASRSVVPVL